MNLLPVSLLVICAAPVLAQDPSVDQIMAKVAENQAHAQEMRRAFVYNQKIEARFRRANGKLTREEKLEYLVTPTPEGVEKKLVHFQGKYEHKGQFFSYDEPGKEYKGLDVDGNLIKEMVNDMTADSKTKDGIGHDLFPLTAEEQEKYVFTL